VKTKKPLKGRFFPFAEREGFSSLAELLDIQNKSAREIAGLPIFYPKKHQK